MIRRGMFRAAWALALPVLGACGNEVEIVTPSGSGSGGEGAGTSVVASASSGAPQSKVISITADATAEDLADGIVFQSRVDGSLVASWSALQLPVTTTAVEGDLVTFGWRHDGPYATRFHSQRVTSSVATIHDGWSTSDDAFAPSCEVGPATHVVVHLPPVAGAEVARVSGARTGAATAWSLPADVELDVAVCAGEKISLLAAVSQTASEKLLASQLWEGIEPAPGGTVTLEATLDGAPRKALPVQITGLAPEGSLWCDGHWANSFAIAPLFLHNERITASFSGVASFLFAPDVLDLPGGFPLVWCNGEAQAPDGACGASIDLLRLGRSDVPIAFPADLAQPRYDAGSWSFGPGTISDRVLLSFVAGDVLWALSEDAQLPPFPIAFPALPPLPPALHGPTSDLVIDTISHGRADGVSTNATDVDYTTVSRRTHYDCD